MKLIIGTDAINAAIKSIKTRGAKLDKDIQRAALSTMNHHSEHGDVTLINRLVDAMPAGSRVNALREFIETFGAVLYDPQKKVFIHKRGAKARIEEAAKVMWTEFKPEKAYQPIVDPHKLVQQLLKRMTQDQDKLGEASAVTPELISGLNALAHAEPAH